MTPSLNIPQLLDELISSKTSVEYLFLEIKKQLKNSEYSLNVKKNKIFKPGYIELISNCEINVRINLYEPGIYDIYELEKFNNKKGIREMCLFFANDELNEIKSIDSQTEYCIKNKCFLKKERIVINKNLSLSELSILKAYFKTNKNSIIEFDFQYIEQYKEILSLCENREIEIALNPQFRKDDFVFLLNNKNKISFFKTFYVFEENNLSLETDRKKINIDKLIKKEEMLYLITHEIEMQNLTPLETYLYVYNIVKNFKKYKLEEADDDIWLSRNTVYTLFNEYICCAGYANLVEEIIDRLENPNLKASTFMLTVLVNENKINHERNLIRIVDEKYNIDGLYTSDATFDSMDHYNKIANDLGFQLDIDLFQKDIYTHFLLTNEEVEDERIIDFVYSESDILFEYIPYFEILKPELSIKMINIINKLYSSNYAHLADINFWPIKQQEISGDKISEAVRVIYERIYCMEKNQVNYLIEECLETNDVLSKFTFNTKNDKFDSKNKKI